MMKEIISSLKRKTALTCTIAIAAIAITSLPSCKSGTPDCGAYQGSKRSSGTRSFSKSKHHAQVNSPKSKFLFA